MAQSINVRMLYILEIVISLCIFILDDSLPVWSLNDSFDYEALVRIHLYDSYTWNAGENPLYRFSISHRYERSFLRFLIFEKKRKCERLIYFWKYDFHIQILKSYSNMKIMSKYEFHIWFWKFQKPLYIRSKFSQKIIRIKIWQKSQKYQFYLFFRIFIIFGIFAQKIKPSIFSCK